LVPVPFLLSRGRFKKKKIRVLFINQGKKQDKKDEDQSVFFMANVVDDRK